MKIVLKSLLTAIADQLAQAECRGRTPEYIVVTAAEFSEIVAELPTSFWFEQRNSPKAPPVADRVFPRRSTVGMKDPEYRAPQRMMLLGYPLYVVPAEYHP